MVKLPEPLDYDYVDEYLDEKFMFFQRESRYHGNDVIIFGCRYANGEASTHVGHAFSVKDDTTYEVEGADGYCAWFGRTDMDEEYMAKFGGAHKDDTGIPYEFTGEIS